MKKALALILALALVFGVCACSASNAGTEKASETAPETNTETPAASTESTDDAAKEAAGFTLWLPCTDETDAMEFPPYLQAINYNKDHPEAPIKIELIGGSDDDYQQKWTLAAANDNLPDLLYTLTGRLDEWAKAGAIVDMTDGLGDVVDKYAEGSIETANALCGGGIYGLPAWSETQGWVYNTQLFEQCGLELPETYEDLLECVKVFNENGIVPIAEGGIDNWAIWGYHAFFTRYGLTQEMADQLQSGELKFADCEPIVKSFEKLQELHDSGAIDPDGNTLSHDQAFAKFEAGQAAMYTVYSSIIDSLTDPANAEHIAYDVGPEFSDGVLGGRSGLRIYGWGWACGKSAKSDDAKFAAICDFMKYVTEPEQVDLWVQFGYVPATKEFSVPEGASMFQQDLIDASSEEFISTTDAFTYWFDDAYIDAYRTAVTGVLCGDLDAEGGIAMMQEAIDMNL